MTGISRRIMSGFVVIMVMFGLSASVGVQGATASASVASSSKQGEPTPPTPRASWEKYTKNTVPPGWVYGYKSYPDAMKKSGADSKKFTTPSGVVAAAPPPGATVYRNYHIIRQVVSSPVDGVVWDQTIADPYLNYASDYHGVLEGSVQDGNGNVVEVGWTVNPVQCPSEPAGTAPCVFVYSWEGGVGQGYAVGFTPAAGADYAPGDLLPNPNDSSGLNFRIIETAGEWWIGVGNPASAGYWMGYYSKANWTAMGTDATAPFDQMTALQVFTETASTEVINATWNTTTPCSDSGNGYTATAPNGGTQAARVLNIKTTTGGGAVTTNAAPTWLNDPSTIPAQAGGVFPTTTPAANNFRIGGPGWKGNNTLPGSRDICG